MREIVDYMYVVMTWMFLYIHQQYCDLTLYAFLRLSVNTIALFAANGLTLWLLLLPCTVSDYHKTHCIFSRKKTSLLQWFGTGTQKYIELENLQNFWSRGYPMPQVSEFQNFLQLCRISDNNKQVVEGGGRWRMISWVIVPNYVVWIKHPMVIANCDLIAMYDFVQAESTTF